ncbi:MAG: SAM-dependent methyltransferase [Elusimicrobiota bacterium]
MIRFVFRLVDALKRRKFEKMFARADPFRYAALEFESRRFKLMARALEGRRYARALEVGCAEGSFTKYLAPLCESLLAMDISSTAVDRARAALGSGARVSFVRANLRDWEPAAGERFDLVVLSEVLYYLGERNDLLKAFAASPDDYVRPVLERVARSLAPRGRVLLAHSYAGELRERRVAYRRILESLGLKLVLEEEVEPTGEAGTDRCLVSLLEA